MEGHQDGETPQRRRSMEANYGELDVLANQLPVGDCCKKLIGRFLSGDLAGIITLKPSYTGSFCSRKDVEDLLYKQMLQDDVIDLCISIYKEKILHKEPLPPFPCFFVNVHSQKFTERIKENVGYLDNFIDMTDEDLATGNALLFVVIHSSNHWSLLVLDFGACCFFSCDSNPNNTAPIAETRLWADLLSRYFLEKHQLRGLRDWLLFHPESPKQSASLDCGLFVLKFIDCFAYNQPFQFTQVDMDHLRGVYAATLIAESVNEGDNHLCYYQCSVKRLFSQAVASPGRESGWSGGAKVSTAVAGAAGILQSHQVPGEKLQHTSNMEHKSRKKNNERFWQHVEILAGNEKRCRFCSKTITAQSISRMKYHWAGVEGKGVSACERVPAEVKDDAKEDVDRLEARQENWGFTCDFCGTTTPSQLKMTYHKAGAKRHGVRSCKKISADDRRAALEEIPKLEAARVKRPRSFPNEVGPSHLLPSGQARKRQSSQPHFSTLMTTAAVWRPENAMTIHDLSTEQFDPNNEGTPSAIPALATMANATYLTGVAHYDPVTSHPLPISPAHQSLQLNPSHDVTPSTVATSVIISGNETHWTRESRILESSNTQGDLALQHSRNQVREDPGLHSANISAHDGQEIHTPTQPGSSDTAISKIKWAIQEWLFFTGFPVSHLSTGEFSQLYDIIAMHGSSNRCMLPLIASSNKEVASNISKKFRHEVDDYVKMVRGSWSSTKCTICIKDFEIPNEDMHIFAAMARSQEGTIFLKYDLVPLPRNTHRCQARAASSKVFLRSIIKDVGLDNISHIMIPYNMSFRYDNKIIILVDVAYHLAKAYINIYHEVRGLLFLEYAVFTASVFSFCFEELPTKVSTEHLNLLSTMLERKQHIRFLQTEVDYNFIAGLTFWNSEEAYNNLCEMIEHMLQVSEKDEDFIFPKYSDVLKLQEKRQKVCNLIVDIIAGDNILSNSKFWNSVEAFMCLYNHIHKIIHRVGENFTFADYFLTYIEARRIILKEDFCDNDYTKIMEGVDNLLPGEEYGHPIACYLCPWIRFLKPDICKIEHTESKLLEMMEGDDSSKEQLQAYREKNNTLIKEEAWSPTQMMTDPKIWWDKWGNKVKKLQSLAIKILNGFCSNNHNWRIMYDMYMSMSIRSQGQKLHDLLYVRLNNNLKHTTAKGQDEGLSWIGSKMAVDLTDFNDHFLNKYFTNDVY